MKPRTVSLYLHIPFCRRRCPYCTFYHVPHVDRSETPFVDALLAEIDHLPSRVGGYEVATMFIGGGTPSTISVESLGRVMERVTPRFASGAGAPDVEVTVEVNPEDVTCDVLGRMRAFGVNRISIGMQSMDGDALRVLGRCRPSANRQAVELVADRFDNYSVDVLLGVPGGAPGHLPATLQAIEDIAPPHVSVYCLEPGGVLEAEAARFFERLDAEQAADEYLVVCEALRTLGYEHYEVSNFARPGYESRHNRAYWEGETYVGLGPGAHSYVDGIRSHNVSDLDRYVDSGGGTVAEISCRDPRTPAQERLEAVMLALRTARGMNISRLRAGGEVLDDLRRAGLATVEHERLVLTDAGYLVLNEIVDRLTAADDAARRPSDRGPTGERLDRHPG